MANGTCCCPRSNASHPGSLDPHHHPEPRPDAQRNGAPYADQTRRTHQPADRAEAKRAGQHSISIRAQAILSLPSRCVGLRLRDRYRVQAHRTLMNDELSQEIEKAKEEVLVAIARLEKLT